MGNPRDLEVFQRWNGEVGMLIGQPKEGRKEGRKMRRVQIVAEGLVLLCIH